MSISKQISQQSDISKFAQPSGPRLSFDQNPLQKYQIQQIDSNTSLHQQQMKNTVHYDNNSRLDAAKQLTRRRRSEMKVGFNRTSFLRTINRNALVQKFKNLLFLRSYVLSKENKHILLHEYAKNLQKRYSTSSSSIPYIMAGTNVSQILTLWSLFMYIFTLWATPFVVSFQLGDSIAQSIYLIIVFQVFIDIFVKINSPLVINGETVFDRQEIVKAYIKKNFLEDLIYLFCLFCEIIGFSNISTQGLLCLIIIIISYRKMNFNYETYYEILYLKGQYNYAIDVLSLIVIIFSYAHVMGCIWHFVGDITTHTGKSWIIARSLEFASIWERYNSSFYWATMTMSTVGYGDITPTNQTEILAANVLMILSSCMFGYSISQIGMILKSQYEVQQKYKRSIILMNSYMKNGQVNFEIQSRIRNYLKFQCETETSENKDDINKIVNELPIGLKTELIQDVQMNIMRKIKILNNQFSQQTLKQLSSNLQEFKFTPGDVIFHRNDFNDQSLYYIQEGAVNLYEENSQKHLQTLKSGQTFGQYQFFTGYESKTSARSQGFSKIFKLQRISLITLLNSNNKDFQRFHHIKDCIIFNQNYQIVQATCNYCKMSNHLNIDCPLLSYQPDIFQRIKKSDLQYTTQKRMRCVRNNEKINCLYLHSAIRDSVEEYKANLSTAHLDEMEMKLFISNATRDINSLVHKETSPLSRQVTGQKLQLKKRGSGFVQQKPLSASKKVGMFMNMRTICRDSDKQLKSESEDEPMECASFKKSLQNIPDYIENQQQLLEFEEQFQTTNYDIDKLMNYCGYMPNSNIIYAIRKYERLCNKWSKLRTFNSPEGDYPKYMTIMQNYTGRGSIHELLQDKY